MAYNVRYKGTIIIRDWATHREDGVVHERENGRLCLEAINANDEIEGTFESLEEAFRAWGFFNKSHPNDRSEIVYRYEWMWKRNYLATEGIYEGELRDQEVWLRTIAPYADDKVIHVTGEDDKEWLWIIKGGSFERFSDGKLLYIDRELEKWLKEQEFYEDRYECSGYDAGWRAAARETQMKFNQLWLDYED